MDVKQDDSDVQQNLKMKGHKDSSMRPQSKMVVQEKDSTVQTKPKIEVQDDAEPTEKSNVQPTSKIGVQEGSNMQLESSLVFHVELIRQLTWEMVVPEDSQLFPDIANSQV